LRDHLSLFISRLTHGVYPALAGPSLLIFLHKDDKNNKYLACRYQAEIS